MGRRRRKQCLACGERYTTIEVPDAGPARGAFYAMRAAVTALDDLIAGLTARRDALAAYLPPEEAPASVLAPEETSPDG